MPEAEVNTPVAKARGSVKMFEIGCQKSCVGQAENT